MASRGRRGSWPTLLSGMAALKADFPTRWGQSAHTSCSRLCRSCRVNSSALWADKHDFSIAYRAGHTEGAAGAHQPQFV